MKSKTGRKNTIGKEKQDRVKEYDREGRTRQGERV
jgi:hypothetical protein